MITFRFRYAEAGGHTHVRLFAGRVGLGKCGDLVFTNEEWKAFRKHIDRDNTEDVKLEFKHEEDEEDEL